MDHSPRLVCENTDFRTTSFCKQDRIPYAKADATGFEHTSSQEIHRIPSENLSTIGLRTRTYLRQMRPAGESVPFLDFRRSHNLNVMVMRA